MVVERQQAGPGLPDYDCANAGIHDHVVHVGDQDVARRQQVRHDQRNGTCR